MPNITNRRTLLGALAALPALAGGAAADPAADPVFAAIARHEAARARFYVAIDITDNVLAAQQGRTITAADRAEYRCAADAEEREFLAVVSTPPLTRPGARAMLEYVSRFDLSLEVGEDALPALIGALLRSPLIAG